MSLPWSSLCVFLLASSIVCMAYCVCIHVFLCARVCTCTRRPGAAAAVLLSYSPPRFWRRLTSLAVSSRHPRSLPPQCWDYWHVLLCAWVSGTQTLVLTLVWQALYQLIHVLSLDLKNNKVSHYVTWPAPDSPSSASTYQVLSLQLASSSGSPHFGSICKCDSLHGLLLIAVGTLLLHTPRPCFSLPRLPILSYHNWANPLTTGTRPHWIIACPNDAILSCSPL